MSLDTKNITMAAKCIFLYLLNISKSKMHKFDIFFIKAMELYGKFIYWAKVWVN